MIARSLVIHNRQVIVQQLMSASFQQEVNRYWHNWRKSGISDLEIHSLIRYSHHRMKLSRADFERLVLEQADLLYRLARRLMHDPNSAEDLVQETFLRALRARENFNLKDFGIRPWLVRIMHNLQISRGEREARQPTKMSQETLEGMMTTDGSLPIDPVNFDAMDDRLVGAINDLPPEYRTVMLLWAVEEFSYKEIADSLDIPVGTVMSRLFRARKQLASQLHDHAVKTGFIRE